MGTEQAAPPADIEFKTATGTVLNTDDENGIVEALVSVTGIVDDQGDLIEPGAYADTLARRKSKGVRHHDWTRLAAKTLIQEEWLPGDRRLPANLPNGDPWPKEAGALYIKGQYNLETKDGREGYSNAKFFKEDGQWSIGYRPGRGGAKRRNDGVRILSKVEFYEWSDVLHGAAPQTSTLTVKAANVYVDTDDALGPEIDDDALGEDPGSKGDTPVDMETKVRDVLPGSYEERREALRDAVRQALGGVVVNGEPEWWVYVVGTWDDHVVVTRSHRGPMPTETYDVAYTIAADGAVTLGQMTRVQLMAQVVPMAGKSVGQLADATVDTIVDLIEDTAGVLAMALAAAEAEGKADQPLAGGDVDRLYEAFDGLAELVESIDGKADDDEPDEADEDAGDGTDEADEDAGDGTDAGDQAGGQSAEGEPSQPLTKAALDKMLAELKAAAL